MKSDPRWIGLAGFALGLAVGGGAVWTLQPTPSSVPVALSSPAHAVAGPEVPASQAQSGETKAPDSAATADTTTGDPAATSTAPTPPATEAKAALDDLIAQIGKAPENERAGAVTDFLYRMKALGPAGLKVIEDFFQRGEDMKLGSGTYYGRGRLVEAPTLRTALLNGLNEWKDPTVLDLSLKVLHETPDLMEASIAIRNLEKRAPGTYRDEAVQTIQELLAAKPAEGQSSWNRISSALDAMRYFKSPELMASVEAQLATQPGIVSQYFASLQAFPAADQRAAMQRVLANPQITKQLADQPYILKQLDFTEPKLQQQMVAIFSTQMSAKNRDEFLNDFESNSMYGFGGLLSGGQPRPAQDQGPDADRTRAQAKLNFLNLIAPYTNTPVLQQRLSEARTALLEKANPKKEP